MSFYESYSTDWSEDSVRIINTPGMTARQSFFYIQEAGFFRTKPGYFTERMHLPSYLILYTQSGNGVLEIGGEAYPVPPGSILYIDCMERHRYAPADGKPWEFFWVHFNGATSEGYHQCFRSCSAPVVSDMEAHGVKEIMEQIVSVNRVKQQQNELINSGLLVELMTRIILRSAPKYTQAEIPAQMREVIRFLERHFDQPLTLDALSDRFSISKYHLSREFKKYTGYSPLEYLIQYRVSRAKELLKGHDLSIAQISESVGIPAENHFCALYKSREGCTPRAYRKLWQG